MVNTKICPESNPTQQVESFMEKDTTIHGKINRKLMQLNQAMNT
jgi:hypothetical protein